MARKKRQTTRHSGVQRDLRTPKYRLQVVPDKRHYDRKKHKAVRLEDCPKAA